MAGSTHARAASLSQTGRLASLFALTVLLYLERSAFPSFVKAEPSLHSMSKTSAGRLMSWFYVGYFLTQLPGGWLAWRYGGDVVLIRSTVVWGLLTVVVSDYGDLGGPAVLLPLLRVAIGCLQGVAFPAIHSILADALAAEDRPRAVSLVTSGMYAGTALAQLGLVEGAAVRIELAWIGALAVGWAGSYHMTTRGVLVSAEAEDSGGTEKALARRDRPSLQAFLRSSAVMVLLVRTSCASRVLHIDLTPSIYLRMIARVLAARTINFSKWLLVLCVHALV
jgi:MFS family permease